MRVVLINPPQPEEDLKSAFSKGKGFILPYNLLSLGTYLRQKGVETDILDCVAEGISLERLGAIVNSAGYDIAGITGFTFSIPQAYKAAEIIKRHSPSIKVVLGGIHASVLPEQTLQECSWSDFVVIGEGEIVLAMLVEALGDKGDFKKIPNLAYRENNSVKMTLPRPMFVEAKDMPVPDYSMLKMHLYVPHSGNYKVLPTYSFYVSRGCPYQCVFCSANIIPGKKVRYKDMDRAIEEMGSLIDDYGTRGLIFQDSNFTLDKEWVKEFCNRMLKERFSLTWRIGARADCIDKEILRIMKKAGCHRVDIGFESGNQDTLNFLKKGTTVEQNLKAARMVLEEGLELGASFIIGAPNEGIKEVLNTIDFAKRIYAKFTQFYLPVPYPGTRLRELCRPGLRRDALWHDYSSRDYSNPVYLNRNFSEEVFKKLADFAYREYYCNLPSLKRILFSSKSMDELKDNLKISKDILKKWLRPVSLGVN